VEFNVLGPVRAVAGGSELVLGGRHPAHARTVAARPWTGGERRADVDAERGMTTIRPPGQADVVYVSRLRTSLGPGWVSTHAGGCALSLDGAVFDTDRFERAVRWARVAPSAEALGGLVETLAPAATPTTR
jgi:hypothetical protein